MLIRIVILLIGFLLLVKGADWFVDGTAGLAKKMGIPQLVIGLTIVAMGTSLPETSVSITAALKGNAEIAVGNVVGSNILNVLLILGVTSFIRPLTLEKSTVQMEIPFMIFVTCVLLGCGISDGKLTFLEGILFLVLFIGYLGYLFLLSKVDKGKEEDGIPELPLWHGIVFILLGLLMVIIGSEFVVKSASAVAEDLGISDRIIGLTIVAFGTSLPELVTSVTAARKGNAGIAIGNIVGSNIYNILVILGVTTLIAPAAFASQFLIDTAMAAFAGILLWMCTRRVKQLRWNTGLAMLLCYAGYVIYLLVA
ncbi:MAG: calcium/sodium antiporter [Lachnospiraceae bacterium]|nr:calcium/sodium antiporter [Lachnospiraceae bacterium]